MLKQWYSHLCCAGLLSVVLAPSANAVEIEQHGLSNSQYSNTASGSSQGPQGSTMWQLYQEVQQLEEDLRKLRGQLEDQQDTIDKTQKELKNRYADLDQRIEMLSPDHASNGGSASSDGNTTNPATEPTQTPVTTPPSNNTPASKEAAPSENIPNNVNPVATTNNASTTNSDRDAYIGAYEVYKSGGAAKAIPPMQQFITTYPNSVFVPNAYYWLGEFYLASNPANFDKAKQNFALVVNKFPKSAKAPAALYRLATITKEVDRRQADALTLMKKLAQNYPGTQEAGFAQTFIKSHS